MNPIKLKYEFSQEEVNYLLNAIDRLQVTGIKQQKSNLYMAELLQKPINAEDLEKGNLKDLKEKYEKKK